MIFLQLCICLPTHNSFQTLQQNYMNKDILLLVYDYSGHDDGYTKTQ